MKLLIFKVNQLGDNVVFLPNLQDLLQRFRDWRIHVLTSPSAAPLYQGLLPTEQLHVYPTHDFNKAWKNPALFNELLWKLRSIQAQACLIAEDQGNVAHLLSILSGCKIRVGSKLRFLKVPGSLTAEVKPPPGKSVPWWGWQLRRRLLEELELDLGPDAPPPPDLSHLLTNEKASTSPYIVIHPGGSLPYKRWFLESFTSLANQLCDEVQVIWVAHDLTPPTQLSKAVEIYRPESLPAFIQRLSQASLTICNNSGPLHLANAVNVPVIAFSGPSQPSWDPIWHQEKVRILRHDSLPCLPCDPVHGQQGRCTNEQTPMACMEAWSVDHVVTLARQVLAAPSPSA